MEDEENEIELPGWALILLIIVIVGGLSLAFYAGFNTYILGAVLVLSVIALTLVRAGVLNIDFKITKDEDGKENEKDEQ